MFTDLEAIIRELDELHAVARRSYRNKNVRDYESLFTPDLRYVQPDGSVISRHQLMQDVARQFAQVKKVDSEFERESIAANANGTVTQILRQTAFAEISVFIFFAKRWNVQRRGRYTYRRTAVGWRIVAVEILDEAVS